MDNADIPQTDSQRHRLRQTPSERKTRGKGALGPLLAAPAGASKRETPTSNLTKNTGLTEVLRDGKRALIDE